MQSLTYKKSGVDIVAANIFKCRIKNLARRSFSKGVLKDIGGFGGCFRFATQEYKEPVLVSSVDGVGTKLKIACLANKHDTIGIDAVAMNVNDILCTGAKPLFFLDYIGYSRLNESVLLDIVRGVNQGCLESGCVLIGGETAQMPGMYHPGDYDLAGFCVGAVEKKEIIDGSKIKAGDTLIGLGSSGLHANGYALVRKVFSKKELKAIAKELLKPTRIYAKPVLSLLQPTTYNLQPTIKGIAHITGGAFYDKIARILPGNLSVLIKKGTWPIPKIFQLIQAKGNISDKEMYHTFNMGIGMVLVVDARIATAIIRRLSTFRLKFWVIGEVVKGKKTVSVI